MTLPPLDPDPAGSTRPTRFRHRLNPEAETRRRLPQLPWTAWAALAAILFALAFGVVMLVRSNDAVPVPDMTTSAGAPVVPVTPAPATVTHDPSVPDLPEGAVSGDPEGHDGYRVGTDGDIPAGKYATAGAIDGSSLPGQWSRSRVRSAPEGIPETAPSAPTIVASNSSVGPTTVSLRDGDTFFTRGYKPWHKVAD